MNKPKSEAARVQLERAIGLFFEGEDYISCITLAGAAEEICRCILYRQKKDSAGDMLRAWALEHYPDSPVHENFWGHANTTRNALKHFTKEAEDSVYVDKEEAQYWVTRALLNYDRAGLIFTEPMTKLMLWLRRGDA